MDFYKVYCEDQRSTELALDHVQPTRFRINIVDVSNYISRTLAN
jgi:hypothetical protein